MALIPVSAFSAAAGGGSWYHFERGVDLSGDFGTMDETKSGTKYENSLYSTSVGAFFRAGLRFTSVSIGISGAADVLTGSLSRRTAATVGSSLTYDFQMLQALAGGFIGVTLWGDANGPELFAEYYLAHRTVPKIEAVAENPFRSYDALNGNGWGAGLSFNWNPKLRVGLMYRELSFGSLNISGTADPVSRSSLQTQQAMIFIGSRL